MASKVEHKPGTATLFRGPLLPGDSSATFGGGKADEASNCARASWHGLASPAYPFQLLKGNERKTPAFVGGCPFWLVCLKFRAPWFTWWLNHLPGPSIFQKGHLCLWGVPQWKKNKTPSLGPRLPGSPIFDADCGFAPRSTLRKDMVSKAFFTYGDESCLKTFTLFLAPSRLQLQMEVNAMF